MATNNNIIRTPRSLLQLPAEIRDEIYDYAINWPDFSGLFSRREARLVNPTKGLTAKDPATALVIDVRTHKLQTPGLLLVNHQVTAEVLPILYNKILLISSPIVDPQRSILAKPFEITDFIARPVLQKIRFVALEVQGTGGIATITAWRAGCWSNIFENLQEIWGEKNYLERVSLSIEYEEPDRSRGWTFSDDWHYRKAMRLFDQIRHLAEHVPVEFLTKTVSEWLKPKNLVSSSN